MESNDQIKRGAPKQLIDALQVYFYEDYQDFGDMVGEVLRMVKDAAQDNPIAMIRFLDMHPSDIESAYAETIGRIGPDTLAQAIGRHVRQDRVAPGQLSLF